MNNKMRIGIIGCDSFHAPILLKQFQDKLNVDVAFVDITLRSTLDVSKKRQVRFESMIEDKTLLKFIDLDDHEAVDLYCILNMDASQHLETIQALAAKHKPIFVDKPIFNNIQDFDAIKGMNIMSSSGLRYCDFIKDVKLDNHILIEGPLSFMEGVEGYFWYGIHLVEMLHTLTSSAIHLESVQVFEDKEVVRGKSGDYSFELIGYYDEATNFSINKNYKLSSYDDLYYSLAHAIVNFKENMESAKTVITTVESINIMRKKVI